MEVVDDQFEQEGSEQNNTAGVQARSGYVIKDKRTQWSKKKTIYASAKKVTSIPDSPSTSVLAVANSPRISVPQQLKVPYWRPTSQLQQR